MAVTARQRSVAIGFRLLTVVGGSASERPLVAIGLSTAGAYRGPLRVGAGPPGRRERLGRPRHSDFDVLGEYSLARRSASRGALECAYGQDFCLRIAFIRLSAAVCQLSIAFNARRSCFLNNLRVSPSPAAAALSAAWIAPARFLLAARAAASWASVNLRMVLGSGCLAITHHMASRASRP